MRKFFLRTVQTAAIVLLFLVPAAYAKTTGDPYIPEYDTSGNPTKAEDIFTRIAGYDLSAVFAHPTGYLGFIGNDGQRFYIHFSEVRKSSENPYEYRVTGKTKVKNNICSFTGSLTIVKGGVYRKNKADDEFPEFQQGFVGVDVELFETQGQPGSGAIRGILQSYITIDRKNRLGYDGLRESPNNLFAGTWTSYKTGASKICNFGHWRFPHTGLPEGIWLDQGVAQFFPKDEYIEKGWQSYAACFGGYQSPGDTRTRAQAREDACREEEEQWWQK